MRISNSISESLFEEEEEEAEGEGGLGLKRLDIFCCRRRGEGLGFWGLKEGREKCGVLVMGLDRKEVTLVIYRDRS